MKARPVLRLALVAALATFGAGGARGEDATVSLLRGPFLQAGSDERVVVRWRTSGAASSRVVFGSSPEALDRQATSSGTTAEHAVVLTGLDPESDYYYAIESGTQRLAGGDAAHKFRTPPAAGTGRQVRFWALGDHGMGDANAAAVRAGFDAWNQGRTIDGVLALGDNAYDTGTDAEYQARFFEPLQPHLRGHYLWPVYGNHDAMSSRAQFQTGPYFESFTMPREGECGGRPSGTEAYYSFDVGDVHVVVIDSSESSMRANGPMVGWLTLDLAANLRPWTIVLAHHPPYTFGSHNSDDPEDSGGNLFEIRENVVPVLDDAGVDLMLTGHSHGYERSRPIDGHYGTSDTYAPSMNKVGGDGDPDGDGAYLKAAGPNGGVVHVVSGSSSKAVPQMALHPTMVRAMPVLGSVVVEVGGDVLDGWFVRPDGTIDDHFQLRREPDGGGGGGDDLFADGFETGWGGWTYHN